MYRDHILMDGISNMIFVVNVRDDNTFIYEFLNTAAIQRTGLSQEVIGKKIEEVFSDEMASFLVNQYSNVVSLDTSLTYEDTYHSPTGDLLYSNVKLTPLYNKDKKCKQIVAEVMDMTKQKEEELARKSLWKKLNESNQWYQSLFQYNTDAVVSLDLNGKIVDCNIMALKVTGYKKAELIGSSFGQMIHSKDTNLLDKLLIHAIKGSTDNSYITIETKSKTKIMITLKVVPIIVDHKVNGVYGIFRDVTKERESEQMLKEQDEKLCIIAENASDLITLIDEKGIITFASPSYKQILGKDYSEYIGKHYLHCVSPEDKKMVSKKVERSIQERKKFKVQFRQFKSNGDIIWCEGDGSPTFDEQGNFKHIVIITRDINNQKEYESKLKLFALHDSLTGLPNRRYFNDKLKQAIQEFTENNEGLAVIMLDLDNFKGINDTFGHDIGDSVIVEFGQRISSVVNKTGFVARLGGDEFVILLPKISEKENAIAISYKVKDEIKRPWNISGFTYNPTTSMGIAIASPEVSSYSLLKSADLALYEAKKAGKDSYYLWDTKLLGIGNGEKL
jgi:diguanylate cyclase (GGDEF)-like protein/PAS domain S-box-containing protein